MNVFAQTIMDQKYSVVKDDGTKETWEEIAKRVANNVLKAAHVNKAIIREVEQLIIERKFIPGGRYLYSAGKQYHQVQNCVLLRVQDSREGWADHLHKNAMSLMSGAGVGTVYSDLRGEGKPIRKTGGTATGPIALIKMTNECGRGIMQGGSRRSALWAGLHWNHADIYKFIVLKNWTPEVRALKEKDFNFNADADMTNISVILDDDFFDAYADEKNVLHTQAQQVYWATIKQMLKTAEPGFSIDTGKNKNENLRNACVIAGTEILTNNGYLKIESLLNKKTIVWNGFEWSQVIPKITGKNQEVIKVTFSSGQTLTCTNYHEFVIQNSYNTNDQKRIKAYELEVGHKLIKHKFPIILTSGVDVKEAYTQGFISGDGMDNYRYMHLYETKYMCLERLVGTSSARNVNSNKINFTFSFKPKPKTYVPFEWNIKSKLNWFAGLLDSDGTELKDGGAQIASTNKEFLLDVQKLLHYLGEASKVSQSQEEEFRELPDGNGGSKEYFCQNLYRLCVGATQIQRLKELGLHCERLKFDKSPQRDASQFNTVIKIEKVGIAKEVYCFNESIKHLGCFNGIVTGQCTEITSSDDSDICNIGSINMAQIKSVEDMKRAVELGTMFLLAGTIYSDVPYSKIDQVRTKNRRLGLGLMGLHEWLITHNYKYGPCDELEVYLQEYALANKYSNTYADKWDISRSVKTRAIAPTGTIGILAETSTGIEPIFCAAYKRRYLKHTIWNYQYVIDPIITRLVESGMAPEDIEDAYSLAENVEKRVEFQAWVQKYVDHGISSTINLPHWGSESNNKDTIQKFGNMLINYLPKLRGLTVYPDGARGGQPLVPVHYKTALKHIGEVFEEASDICTITKGGSCGE